MAQNPLLGKRISLISKKNIRYEGVLYSINEQNATVALQNVKSFGSENRPIDEFVPASNDVHPFLLFRGQDIKDLHVHEEQDAPPAPPEQAQPEPAKAAPPQQQQPPPPPQQQSAPAPKPQPAAAKPAPASAPRSAPQPSAAAAAATNNNNSNRGNGEKKSGGRGNNNNNRRKNNNNNNHAVGTGASLLNRKARGVKNGDVPETPKEAFDFQSNLQIFKKEDEPDEEEDEAGDRVEEPPAYEKNDFFDSLSCDVTDKESGRDTRLRGATERNLNTETFGAVALNNNRRGRRYYGGRGGGRGRGRGGRGRGRGGRGRTQVSS